MTTTMTACVTLDQGMQFTATTNAGHSITMDAPAPAGQGLAATPMELVLIGLAGCSGMDVLTVLRNKHQPVQDLQVRARAERRSEHPTVFTKIALEYVIWGGDDLDHEAVARAIEMSHRRYCPIWAMLEERCEITAHHRILTGEAVTSPCD